MTNIPVPAVHCGFEDDGAYYLITEYIEGVGMNELTEDQREKVSIEVEQHLSTLHALTSDRMGGPTGLIVPPYRVTKDVEDTEWIPSLPEGQTYVFCHNDLSQNNIIVDPETLKINAIIDWEYSGFYPEIFESRFYKRFGPSVAINGEIDDASELLAFLRPWEVRFPGQVVASFA